MSQPYCVHQPLGVRHAPRCVTILALRDRPEDEVEQDQEPEDPEREQRVREELVQELRGVGVRAAPTRRGRRRSSRAPPRNVRSGSILLALDEQHAEAVDQDEEQVGRHEPDGREERRRVRARRELLPCPRSARSASPRRSPRRSGDGPFRMWATVAAVSRITPNCQATRFRRPRPCATSSRPKPMMTEARVLVDVSRSVAGSACPTIPIPEWTPGSRASSVRSPASAVKAARSFAADRWPLTAGGEHHRSGRPGQAPAGPALARAPPASAARSPPRGGASGRG